LTHFPLRVLSIPRKLFAISSELARKKTRTGGQYSTRPEKYASGSPMSHTPPDIEDQAEAGIAAGPENTDYLDNRQRLEGKHGGADQQEIPGIGQGVRRYPEQAGNKRRQGCQHQAGGDSHHRGQPAEIRRILPGLSGFSGAYGVADHDVTADAHSHEHNQEHTEHRIGDVTGGQHLRADAAEYRIEQGNAHGPADFIENHRRSGLHDPSEQASLPVEEFLKRPRRGVPAAISEADDEKGLKTPGDKGAGGRPADAHFRESELPEYQQVIQGRVCAEADGRGDQREPGFPAGPQTGGEIYRDSGEGIREGGNHQIFGGRVENPGIFGENAQKKTGTDEGRRGCQARNDQAYH
jgi:hypothetical protein